ncbi:MAG TPA: SGNH/GDSL hydrolase family protein [Cryptosporangiaceae bacterium]|nr:SGNH/GDSL hydrolase family protein [Cryptosporangiaceae bacterium]
MAAGPWDSFIAMGDSFTEGMDDPVGDGTYRGWADLVAERLAADVDDFRYANLAVRGRSLQPVVDAQVPVALAMRPALVSFAAGGNDALRRRFDSEALTAVYDNAVARLVATGATVLLFAPANFTGKLPARRYLLPRIELLVDVARRVAAERGATLIDLWADDAFANPALWSVDRLHLSTEGHRVVAARVLTALGVEPVPDWRPDPPVTFSAGWAAVMRKDLAWARVHLAPWLGRRLVGRSTGDTVAAKRPTLAPFRPMEESAPH